MRRKLQVKFTAIQRLHPARTLRRSSAGFRFLYPPPDRRAMDPVRCAQLRRELGLNSSGPHE